MSVKYNCLILCSINDLESIFIEMVENALINQNFNTVTIGKNPFIKIETNYIIESVKNADVIVIVITNENNIDLINEILEDNKTIFNIKKKPILLFYDKSFYNILKDKSSYSVMINNSIFYPTSDLQEKINNFVSEFRKKVDDQKLLKDLGKIGLILGGISVGLGLLFSLFKGED